MRINPTAAAKSLSWTVGILYSICTLAVIYLPDLVTGLAGSWFHLLDTSLFEGIVITLDSFITGIVSAMLVSWLAGYFFAGFYNFFSRLSR